MASNLKVDIVKPTATNGSLSLKGDSGGSATTNGISVDSSGDVSITGKVTGATSLDGAVIINESGADVDFRVESDTVDHALFVQGSDGYVGIGVASPADKLHVDGNIRLTSGSGINFSAYATSGNPSSNLLDDYEEGTWTPTNAGDATGEISSVTGYYTKVGNVVTASFSFDVDINFTSNAIGGLPFPPLDIGPNFNGIFLQYAADRGFIVVNNTSTCINYKISDKTAPAITDDTRCTITYLTA